MRSWEDQHTRNTHHQIIIPTSSPLLFLEGFLLRPPSYLFISFLFTILLLCFVVAFSWPNKSRLRVPTSSKLHILRRLRHSSLSTAFDFIITFAATFIIHQIRSASGVHSGLVSRTWTTQALLFTPATLPKKERRIAGVSSTQQISQRRSSRCAESKWPNGQSAPVLGGLAWLASLQTKPGTASQAVPEEGFASLLPLGEASPNHKLASDLLQIQTCFGRAIFAEPASFIARRQVAIQINCGSLESLIFPPGPHRQPFFRR